MNCYGEDIEDSDEDLVDRFTGPRSGRFLPLWHWVHEKSYSRRKELTEMRRKQRELNRIIKSLKSQVARLTPGVGLHTERVSDLINPERTWGWLD